MSNKFINFEGPDGAGKTTIRNYVFQSLVDCGFDCFMVGQHSWLSSGVFSRTIIDFREQRKQHPPAAISNAYFHDKEAHAIRTIKPALNHTHVIADRYIFSDAVYHDVLYNIPAVETLEKHRNARTIFPNLIIFVDVSGIKAAKRVEERGKAKRFYEHKEELSKIVTTYNKLLIENPLPWYPPVLHFINDEEDWQERVNKKIIPKLKQLLNNNSV